MYFTGQNLALGHADWASVIRAWNDEIKYFTYGSADNVFGEIGHFTQVLISYNGRKTLWQIYLHLIGFHHILCLMIKINLAYSPIIISRYSNNWYKILCLFGTLVSIIFVDQRSLEFVVQNGICLPRRLFGLFAWTACITPNHNRYLHFFYSFTVI